MNGLSLLAEKGAEATSWPDALVAVAGIAAFAFVMWLLLRG